MLSRSRAAKPLSRNVRPRLEALEDRLIPATLLALTSAGTSLARFDSATTTSVTTTAVAGLNGGETLLGIDYRPASGQLYGVTSQNRLVTINATSGAISLVAALSADPTDATNPFTALNGAEFGVDFNPLADRLRVVSDTNQNLRINPDNGRVITDTALNPGTPDIVAAAYSNNFAGTATTTLFGLDAAADRLVIQNPPNDGTLATVGTNLGAGIDVTLAAGFDVVTTGTGTNTAFANLEATGQTGLYTINLTTGVANLVSLIGNGATDFRGLTVVPAGTLNFSVDSFAANENAGTANVTVTRTGGSEGAVSANFQVQLGFTAGAQDIVTLNGVANFAAGDTAPKTLTVTLLDDQLVEGNETVRVVLNTATGDAALGPRNTATLVIRDNETPGILLYAVTSGNVLIEFESATPGVVRRSMPILGLTPGEVVEGIDFRPATNQLYGLVVNGTAGRLVTISRFSGVTAPVAPLTADPADATIPFTALAGTDFGFDFNPTVDRIRIVSDADINLSVNPANGQVTTQTNLNPGTPNVVGSAYTNSFNGSGSTTLFAIDSNTDELFIQNPPGNGTLTLVGALNQDTAGVAGFEIASYNNQAFAALNAPGATTSRLFTVDLAIGQATLLGTIGGGATINGLASQSVNEFNFTDTERFVNRLYRDLLGRNAEDSGRISFTHQLNLGTLSRSGVALTILASAEYRGLVVEDLYLRLLRRPADAAGKSNFVAALGAGMTLPQLSAVLVGSAEYFQINGGTNSSFVAAAFLDLLGRPVDAGGLAAFTSFLAGGGTRAAVAQSIVASTEFLSNLTTGYYRFFLLRNPDAAGLAGFVSALQGGASPNAVLASLLSSAEYFGRAI